MDAEIYSLDAMRVKQHIHTRMEKILFASMALDGLELVRSATLFWEQYATAMTSFHVQVLKSAFSPSLKPPKITDRPSNWL